MACRVALPSPAERFSGEGRPSAPAGHHLPGNGSMAEGVGLSRPRGITVVRRSGRPSTACCATEGEVLTDAAFPEPPRIFCPARNGASPGRAQGDAGFRRQSAQELSRPARERKIPCSKCSLPGAQRPSVGGSVLRMLRAEFSRLRGSGPGRVVRPVLP